MFKDNSDHNWDYVPGEGDYEYAVPPNKSKQMEELTNLMFKTLEDAQQKRYETNRPTWAKAQLIVLTMEVELNEMAQHNEELHEEIEKVKAQIVLHSLHGNKPLGRM